MKSCFQELSGKYGKYPAPAEVALWLPRRDAARFIGVSVDTIERRALEWQDEFVPFHVRFKLLLLNQGERYPERRYYRPDLELWLSNS